MLVLMRMHASLNENASLDENACLLLKHAFITEVKTGSNIFVFEQFSNFCISWRLSMSLPTATGASRSSGNFLGSCKCKQNVAETDIYNHLFLGASVLLLNVCFYMIKTTG